MLHYALLKERYQVVVDSKLSLLDSFLLLTTETLDLGWSRSQKIILLEKFKGWSFEATNIEQLKFYIKLIESMLAQVDKDSFIKELEQRQGWYEEWMLFYIEVQILGQDKLIEICKKICCRSNHILHESLIQKIIEKTPCFFTEITLAELYFKTRKYSNALIQYQKILKKYQDDHYLQALKGFIQTLINRNAQYASEISDSEFAVNILLVLGTKKIWSCEYEDLLIRAKDQALLDPLKLGRGKDTKKLIKFVRNIDLLGKGIGRIVGGRESCIPYSKDMITSAPILLTPLDIEKTLFDNTRLNDSLLKLLKKGYPEYEALISSLGITTGMLWTYSQIDASVLDAITFSSKGAPGSFNELQEVGTETINSTGAITRLTGYVAEQQVALNLVRQGHIVELPESSNQEGWDLLVDGSPVQVKCSMDSNYVLSHFEKNPDIPVIVNKELSADLADHPMVIIDPNLSHINIEQVTNDSLQHLDNFNSIVDIMTIPFLSTAFAIHRNYPQYSSKEMDFKKYSQNVGKEVAIRTAGTVSGKFIGGMIGGVGGPIGIIIGSGLGAFIGGVVGATGADAVIRENLCDKRDLVVQQIINFAKWFNCNVLKVRIEELTVKNKMLSQKIGDYLESEEIFSGEPIYANFIAIQTEHIERAKSLENWISKCLAESEFYKVQAGWVALRESGKFFHAEMKNRINLINNALEEYEKYYQKDRMSH